jgi:hypothetical protein
VDVGESTNILGFEEAMDHGDVDAALAAMLGVESSGAPGSDLRSMIVSLGEAALRRFRC